MSVTEIRELPPLAKEVLDYIEIHGPISQKRLADNLVHIAISPLNEQARDLADLANRLEVMSTNPACTPRQVEDVVHTAEWLLQEIRRAHG